RHTRLQGDWSSDVCSSDLAIAASSTSATVANFNLDGNMVLSTPSIKAATLAETPEAARPPAATSVAALTVEIPSETGTPADTLEIGRAACRERVENSVGPG